MNKNILVSIVVIIVALLGGVFLGQRNPSEIEPSAYTPNENTPYTTPSSDTNLIVIDQLGLAFNLPKEYVAYQTEGFEGGYGFSVSIAKEKAPGHFKFSGIRINSFLSQQSYADGAYYFPEKYVEVAFRDAKRDPYSKAEYTTLFGNKAVTYTDQVNGDPVIVGFMKVDEQVHGANSFGIRVAGETYGTGVSLDPALFNQIVSSLRIINQPND